MFQDNSAMFSWSLALLGVLLLTACCPRQVGAAFPKYQVVDLGTIEGFPATIPVDLNDRGEVVGQLFTNASPFLEVPFYWTESSGIERFSSLSGEDVRGLSYINNNGLMLGTTNNNDPVAPRTPFFYDPINGYRVLDGFQDTQVTDLNDHGEIVGYYTQPPKVFIQFRWSESGGLIEVDDDDHGPDGTWSDASFGAINNQGLIGGGIRTPGYEATFWTEADGFMPFGSLPELSIAGVTDMNDSEQVVAGGTFMLDGLGVTRSFYWSQENGVVRLGNLPGNNYDRANDINEQGWIVGSSHSTRSGATRGYLWSLDEGMVELNSLLEPSSQDWYIRSAKAINNHGWILATGVNNAPGRAVLLVPVPEPDAIVLIVLSTLCLVALTSRQVSLIKL